MDELIEKDWNNYWTKMEKSWLLKTRQYILEKFTKQFVDSGLKYSQKRIVVEVGSGDGMDSILLANQRGDEVILIDFSEKALEKGRILAKKYGVKVETINQNIQDKLRIPDKKATLAWNRGTLEHIKKPVEIVKEMKRISSCVICIVPSYHLLRIIYEKLKKLVGIHLGGYYKLYTSLELKEIFIEAGFKDIIIKKYFGFMSFIGAIGVE